MPRLNPRYRLLTLLALGLAIAVTVTYVATRSEPKDQLSLSASDAPGDEPSTVAPADATETSTATTTTTASVARTTTSRKLTATTAVAGETATTAFTGHHYRTTTSEVFDPNAPGNPCKVTIKGIAPEEGDGNAFIDVQVTAQKHPNDSFQTWVYDASGKLLANGGVATNSHGYGRWTVTMPAEYKGNQMKLVFGFPSEPCDNSPQNFTFTYPEQ